MIRLIFISVILTTLFSINAKGQSLDSLISEINTLKKTVIADSLLGKKLNQLGVVYYKQKIYDKALISYQEAREILKSSLGDKNPYYMQVLQNRTLLFTAINKQDSLISNKEEILAIELRTLGPTSSDYGYSLNDLGILYENNGMLATAKSYYQKCLSVFKNLEPRADYYNVLKNLAKLYVVLKEFPSAIDAYLEIASYQKEDLPKSNFAYGSALNEIGESWVNIKNPNKAIPYFEEALAVWESDTSIVSYNLMALRNLYDIYSDRGQYEKLIDIDLKRLNYLSILNNYKDLVTVNYFLGRNYVATNKLDSAIFYFEKVKDSIELNSKSNFDEAEFIYNKIGAVYSKFGDQKQAVANYIKYLKILASTSRENTEKYADQLNTIGFSYDVDKEFEEAMLYYDLANKLFFKLNGELSYGYIQTLSNKASLYNKLKNFDEEQKLLINVSLLSEKAFGDTSDLHIITLNRITDITYKQGKFDQALLFYQKAQSLALRTSNVGLQQTCLSNVAKTNESLNNFDLAIAQYKEVLELKKLKNDTSAYAVVPALNSLGNLYSTKSNFELAEKYFILSVSTIGSDKNLYSELAFALDGLGNLKKKAGNYIEAENYFLMALKIATEIFGDPSEQLAVYQNNISLVYSDMGNFDKALYYVEKSFAVAKLKGELSLSYAIGLSNLALLYDKKGDYEKARDFYTKALAIYRINGEKSKDYALALGNLAQFYVENDAYDKAEILMNQSLALYENLSGRQTEGYRLSLVNLADLHTKTGNYAKGLSEINEALAIATSLFGAKSLIYAVTLETKASLLFSFSKFKEAEDNYLKALKINKEILGVNHYKYADLISSIGRFYLNTDRFDLARPLFEEASVVYKNTFGTNSTYYANISTLLGDLEASVGNNGNAERFYLQAKEIWRIKKGENSVDFSLILNNFASFYDDLGQSDKAIAMYEQAALIRKNLLGEDNPQYGNILNNMAVAHGKIGQNAKAESLALKSLAIAEKIFGNQSSEYAIRRTNLAGYLLDQGKLSQVETINKEAIEIWTRIYGKTNLRNTSALTMLGRLYSKTNRLKEAEDAYLEVKRITTIILGTKHPDYAAVVRSLYRLALKSDDFLVAQKYLLESGEIRINNIVSNFAILSEKEKENFLYNNVSLLEDFNSFIYKYPESSSAVKSLSFNLLLKLKSLTLAETKNVFDRIKQSTDSTTINLYKSWLRDKNYLTFQYNLDKSKQDSNLKAVEDRTEDFEKELTRKSAEFSAGQKSIRVNFTELQKKLAKDEVAIEFVNFDYYNKKWTDSTIYGAYVIRPTDSVPQFIPLCEAKKLDKLFEVAGKNATTMVNSFYRGTKVTNTNKEVLSDSLYNLVWKPLEPYLAGVKKIAYSPSGKLYAVAFNALQDANKKLLIDKYDLQQYTSTREIVLRGSDSLTTKPNNIALFGDAKFSLDTANMNVTFTDQNVSVNYVLPNTRGEMNNSWAALPGTFKEVNQIESLFKENKLEASVYTQVNASEQNIKSLSGQSPQILHLATHGFFLPDPALDKNKKDKSRYELAKDPLLRSGLVLAGGNYAWGGGQPLAGREDGILTAYEISQLDLGQTDLVVLSACETALGDVKGSEGVFGLQRSFKMAGVKNMIVSLWQVPDKETAELMTSFYSNLLNGKPMDEAFSIAQTAMRKKYDPFYWAAFVLIK